MASQTWWTWVWVSSVSWWWTGKPGMLYSWGCKESDTTEQLNWTEGGKESDTTEQLNWTEEVWPKLLQIQVSLTKHSNPCPPPTLPPTPPQLQAISVLSLLHSCILYCVYIFLCDAFRSDQISRSVVSDSLRYFDYSKQASPMLLHFGLALLTEDGGIEIRAMI